MQTELQFNAPRLARQLAATLSVMRSGEWKTLAEIEAELRARGVVALATSISARLRELRGMGYTVDRKKLADGLYAYKVTQ